MTKQKSKLKYGLTVIAIINAVVLAASSFVGCFFSNPNGENSDKGSLNFNYALGEIASEKVENAQYAPDIDKYFEANALQARTNAKTTEDFTALINEYTTVENYAGAGKYLGYDIYEIKDEIKFVVDNVPAFNQWFRMPIMREDEGYVRIPYYESWAYYLEMNEETSMLSITRVCWATRSRYLDFDNRETVEEYADGSSFIQYEIMKINYLETETDEIVECFIYSVGIDKVKNEYHYFNPNSADYYPFEYQYLRNVKDKSTVKYHVTVAERYSENESFDEGGMDIRGLTHYGVRREFTIVNYDGYTDIDVTKIDQKFTTLDAPENNGYADFDVNSNNIKILLEAIGFEKEYLNLSPVGLLDIISIHIIDNFEIKNNWPEIYKEQASAVAVDTILGPFYGKDIWLTDVYVNVDCRSNTIGGFAVYVGANIYDTTKFDLEKEYSLSVALRSRETGKLFVIATEYNRLEKVFYAGSMAEYYYRLKETSYYLASSVISIDEDGTYDLTCVLTIDNDGKHEILFDTLETAYLMRYYSLKIPNSVDDNGVTHKYTTSGTGGKFTITVTSEQN
ncbi:MAG: hypothetical protein K2O89_07600 [Clostridia bacterium]|nr:hypothetical protein [Clostridia bacterium]